MDVRVVISSELPSIERATYRLASVGSRWASSSLPVVACFDYFQDGDGL